MLLPAELIDHIFSFLKEDISALTACSNAHPLISRLAERYLYADIVVRMDNPSAAESYERCFFENPHILHYPRTLEIQANTYPRDLRWEMSFLSTIPRMANLTSLKLIECRSRYNVTGYFTQSFLSSLFENCLQRSSVEQIHLCRIRNLTFSILDNVKTLKKLTLSNCHVAKREPISKSPHKLLETLIIRDDLDKELLTRITGCVPNLESLQLQGVIYDWNAVSELVAACSSSLTELHLNFGYPTNIYVPNSTGVMGYWLYDHHEFPFTLSRHKRLKHLTIFTMLGSTGQSPSCGITSPFPSIVKLIKTALVIQDIVLRLHWEDLQTSSLGIMDWSLLESAFLGIRPRIHLVISSEVEGRSISAERVLDILTKNEALMDLVKREVVILKAEPTAPFGN